MGAELAAVGARLAGPQPVVRPRGLRRPLLPAGRVARPPHRTGCLRPRPGRGGQAGGMADPGEGCPDDLCPRRQPAGGRVHQGRPRGPARPRVHTRPLRMSLVLLDPGLLSLLVDHGRPRWRSLGVPLGGAADRAALAVGNALVGNPPDALALEFTLAGPTLGARDPAACAVFGAPFHTTVNGRPVAAGSTFTLEP